MTMTYRPSARGGSLTVALVLLFAVAPGVAQDTEVVMTERAAAATLLSGLDTPEREKALGFAMSLGPDASPELRWALIQASWDFVEGRISHPEGSEAEWDYLWAVASLRDPRAIPFLIRGLVTGTGVANALADLGAEAFPAVMEAVRNPDQDRPVVSNGLKALRFMIEDGSLGRREIAEVRDVVLSVLTKGHNHVVVAKAIEVVPALGDADLWEIVETLAVDPAAVAALSTNLTPDGSVSRSRESSLDWVREHAHRMVSGEEPYAKRDPFPCAKAAPYGVRCP